MAEVYEYKPERQIGFVSCQCCGQKVEVMLPFVGCVTCTDCQEAINNITADAVEFKRRVKFPEDYFMETKIKKVSLGIGYMKIPYPEAANLCKNKGCDQEQTDWCLGVDGILCTEVYLAYVSLKELPLTNTEIKHYLWQVKGVDRLFKTADEAKLHCGDGKVKRVLVKNIKDFPKDLRRQESAK